MHQPPQRGVDRRRSEVQDLLERPVGVTQPARIGARRFPRARGPSRWRRESGGAGRRPSSAVVAAASPVASASASRSGSVRAAGWKRSHRHASACTPSSGHGSIPTAASWLEPARSGAGCRRPRAGENATACEFDRAPAHGGGGSRGLLLRAGAGRPATSGRRPPVVLSRRRGRPTGSALRAAGAWSARGRHVRVGGRGRTRSAPGDGPRRAPPRRESDRSARRSRVLAGRGCRGRSRRTRARSSSARRRRR